MSLVSRLTSRQPNLKKNLRIAQIKDTPQDYVKKSLKSSLMMGFMFLILSFLVFSKDEPKIGMPILLGVVATFFFYTLSIKKVEVSIRKKAKEIDRGVLFAGRFLLIKLNSGAPLINAIEEASKSYGVASQYFGEIMRDMELGTTIENALEKATEYCPSKHLKKILFQMTNALKIGIDVTEFLDATLDEISDEQMLEIMKYGKKLSSLTMFFMLLAIIVPSLGMTLFVVVASLVSIKLDMMLFLIIALILAAIQFMFITLFRSARPNMEV
ncbi:MAG: type II secretion system F family protein [Candidatus Nanoarchaeia archaeon]|jgi:pilus assembly protein TadC|nr:type II secretion system F family protein [Candidatus Nanoarchaeia archaeon]